MRRRRTAGILRPDEFARHAHVERLPCAPDLAPWVENHWVLTWDLPAGTRFSSQTLPHPACTVSVELGHHREGVGEDPVVVTGVVSRRFDVTTAGSGLGAGREVPARRARGPDRRRCRRVDRPHPAGRRRCSPRRVVDSLRQVVAGTPAADAAALADEALRPLVSGEPDPAYDTVLTLVADMLEDRSLLRVADAGRPPRPAAAPARAALLAVRRRRRQVGAGALPDARRAVGPRRRLRRHAGRPRGDVRLVRPGALHPRLRRARRG